MLALNARESLVFEVVAEEAGTFFCFDAVAGLEMASGGGLHIGGDEEAVSVEFGDMGRGVEEFAIFGGGEDIGDGGGVEAVGAEKLEK